MKDYQLLKTLCAIPATTGDEQQLNEFILEYVLDHRDDWDSQPAIFAGDGFQDSIVLAFGNPRIAIFAHLDSVGYCAAYGNRLIKIGGPKAEDGAILVGQDSRGPIECILRKREEVDEKDKDGKKKDIFEYEFNREIDRGTPLTYKPDWREDTVSIQCCYMDNRFGVWNALELCSNLKDAAIVFTTYEEHLGGTAQFIGRFLYKSFGCRTALISDVTLTSEGIKHGDGVAISMRDKGIPRQRFLRSIIQHATQAGIQFQLEVEDAGGSDGTQLQLSSYPWDWCFIGPPEENYHSPDEKIYKSDIEATQDLY
ncbi:MAG: aminopeptidase, partial [Flavobacteriales bacterium]|nr:aminopeptidase [Flavobacteriales bacterium]